MRPYEGGTVLDAVPAAHTTGTGLAAGQRGSAATIWPAGAGPLPTADHPALALVLTPRGSGTSGTTAPTWVFPFNRPLPPGRGDNQALAVNTTDGSVRYDVSFSLVWADGDTALNKNEAYAFARCTGCTTVAVAFQVVLVAGSVDVVVPQNLSAAVNYGCVQCVTEALATQLVVSVPGPLSDDAAQRLAAVWDELRAFGSRIQDVPLAELQSRLDEYEARILAIVSEDAGTAPADGTGTAPPTTGSPSSSDGAATAGPSDAASSTAPEATTAGTSDGSATSSSSAAAPTSAPATTTSAPAPAGATTATASPTG